MLGIFFWFLPAFTPRLAPDHVPLDWPLGWRTWFFVALGVIVLSSAITVRDEHPALQRRWRGSFHPLTWGAGFDAVRQRGAKP